MPPNRAEIILSGTILPADVHFDDWLRTRVDCGLLPHIPDGIKLSPIGISLDVGEDLPFEVWAWVWKVLRFREGECEGELTKLRWAQADWLYFGEHAYGEKYAQAVQESTNLSGPRLATLCWLAGKIEPERRRNELTIKHHTVVAALPPQDQDALLDEAVEQGWSTRDLAERAFDRAAENDGKMPAVAKAERALEFARECLEAVKKPQKRASLVWYTLVKPLRLELYGLNDGEGKE